MNTTMLRSEVQLEKKGRVWNGKVKLTIYHLPLQPSIGPNSQTGATRIWREQRGLQRRISILQLMAKKEVLWGKGRYPKNTPNFLPDCLPVWGPQTRILICEQREIATGLEPSRRFWHALMRAGEMLKSGGRPCCTEFGLFDKNKLGQDEHKKWSEKN